MQTLREIQPGQILGRYEFLVPIAQGGMAAVWAARLHGTRGFSKTVAIKTMLPTISDDPMFEQMFLDEATLASNIHHPNVCQIQDLGEQNDMLYLVMEWVDGEPLSALRRAAAQEGGIPRAVAVRVIADACAGLHAAHELRDESGNALGLVHRDISPQNILITYDGVVKIVDFGVAKAAGRTAADTNAGQIKGKPPYMSPEQALGEDIDRRTDLFALGIILYQLTTGKHPFRGESDVITLQNIVSDRPVVPPSHFDKEYPKALEAVVLKALTRNPAERFQTAREFEMALDRVFPPNTPRTRTEDVGRYITQLLGERGVKRREALREAIRLADERAFADPELAHLRSMPDLMSQVSLSRLSRTGLDWGGNTETRRDQLRLDGTHHSSITPPPSLLGTPYGTETQVPVQATKRSSTGIIIGGLLSLAVLGAGGALLVTKLQERNTANQQSPTVAGTSEVAQAPGAAENGAGLENPVEPATPPAAADGADAAEADLSPDELLQEAKPNTQPGNAPAKAGDSERPSAQTKQPEERPKPEPTKEPNEKPVTKEPVAKPPAGNGFVPPPVTDPGF